MNAKRVTILVLLSIAIAMSTYIATSYGFYVINSNEKVEMNTTTSTPSCVGLTIASSSTFTLGSDYAVPISDNQFLNSSITTQNNFKYTFTVKNDCTEEKKLSIGFVSFDNNAALLNNLRYILVESGAKLEKSNIKSVVSGSPSVISKDMQEHLKDKYNLVSPLTYKIGDAIISNAGSKTYDLYVWLSTSADNSAMNQSLKATVILYN